MASIRRTLSPINQERSSFHQNGATPSPLSISSPSHKLPQPPPFSSRFFLGFRLFFTGVLHLPEKHSRKAQHKSWKRPFYRCLLFFFVGFLLGVLPFGHNNNVRTHDMSFEIKPESIRAQEEEIRAEDSILKPNDDIKNADDVEIKFDVVLTEKFDYKPRKLLIVVTPTYNNRALQAYYLNRLGQVLKLVNPPVLWVVVEMEAQSQETAGFLRNTGLMYRHLVCKKNVTDIKDWGVHQRNTALEHIELHRLDGIVYFADEDNIYSLELFERIRDISRFGTWPVALLAQSKNKAILEGPVCNESQVAGWHTNEKSKGIRRFHVNMSGFAFNSTILWDPKRWKRPFLNPIRQLDTVKEGFQETTFMEQVIAEESDMESVPHGCGKIMNWHMHLAARGVEYPRGWLLQKNLDAVLSVD